MKKILTVLFILLSNISSLNAENKVESIYE